MIIIIFYKVISIKSKSIIKLLLSLVIVTLRYCGVNLDPTLVLSPQIRILGIQVLNFIIIIENINILIEYVPFL